MLRGTTIPPYPLSMEGAEPGAEVFPALDSPQFPGLLGATLIPNPTDTVLLLLTHLCHVAL